MRQGTLTIMNTKNPFFGVPFLQPLFLGVFLASCIPAAGAPAVQNTGTGPEYATVAASSSAVTQEADYEELAAETVLFSTRPHSAPAQVKPAGLPSLGKWMYTMLFEPADWLGVPYKGKTLYEPINVIISDAYAKTPEEASDRLINAAGKAGFPLRWGHSTGYMCHIDGAFRKQISGLKHHAFSDAHFEEANNHGRIFGPVLFGGKYWFTAAFSREHAALFRKIKHRYASFNEARDKFAWSLNECADYRVSGFIPMENAIIDADKESTGDHDGLAVFLEARNPPRQLPAGELE